MTTSWTNENSGTVATQGNTLEGESLTVTGPISAGSTVNGWTMSGSGLLEAPEGATYMSIMSELNCTENVKFYGTIGSSGNSTLMGFADDGVTIQNAFLVVQKHLTVGDGGSGDIEYIRMFSKDNTASYLFVANDGTLRISNAIPTADGDGAPV